MYSDIEPVEPPWMFAGGEFKRQLKLVVTVSLTLLLLQLDKISQQLEPPATNCRCFFRFGEKLTPTHPLPPSSPLMVHCPRLVPPLP